MSFHVARRPRARRDIFEIAVFIAQDSLDSSDHFLEAVDLTFQASGADAQNGGAMPVQLARNKL